MDEDTLNDFFDSFESTDLDNEVSKLQISFRCLLQTLEHCFFVCSIESLDEHIFKKVLPKAQQFLLKILKAIDYIIANDNTKLDNLNEIKCKLQVCDGLLAFWKKCVERVSTFKQIRAVYVASLCDILPESIKLIFEHCKASPKYGTLLSSVVQELKNLFAKAGTVLKLFFATLNDIIVFDTNLQSETELLTKVIDAYGNIASITNGMDTKTFIELSEIFTKLAIVYQSKIKSYDIATHYTRMMKDVSCFLLAAKNQNDKNMERNVMVGMRLLRILEKLASSYSDFFTHEMMSNLLEFLAQIYGYSYLIQGSEKTILAGATSFLNVIFNQDNFKQVYFEYGKQSVLYDQYTHRLNYHLLTIAIMKKLNNVTIEHYCEWSLGSNLILDIAFTHIKYLEEEICVGDLRVPNVSESGEELKFIGIYEATLIAICNVVSQILPENFQALELLLLKYLLSGHFWCSLLSSDVWCFIGRLSSSQLCVDHIKHLIKISIILIERCDSMEAIMLNNMIARLYDLLNEDVKSTLFNNLITSNIDYVLNMHLSISKSKSFSLEPLKSKILDLPKAFLDLQKYPSTRNWKHFMQIISAMITVDYSDNKDIINVLTEIWNFIASVIIECEEKQLDILTDLIITLFDATHLKSFHDDNFCMILTSVVALCIYLPSRGKIKICYFLQQNIEDLGHYKNQNVASTLTELFCNLLEDENPWVRQEALGTFELVGYMCPEQLVAEIAKTLAKIPSISIVMQAYLSSRPYYSFKGFTSMQDYLRYLTKVIQNNGKHRCYKHNNESEREEKIPKLEEKNSQGITATITQLDEQAEKLYKGLMMVLKDQAVISETVCRKLITVLEKIVQVQRNENFQN